MSNCVGQQPKSLTSFLGIIDLISWEHVLRLFWMQDWYLLVLPNVVILQAHELAMVSHRISQSKTGRMEENRRPYERVHDFTLLRHQLVPASNLRPTPEPTRVQTTQDCSQSHMSRQFWRILFDALAEKEVARILPAERLWPKLAFSVAEMAWSVYVPVRA